MTPDSSKRRRVARANDPEQGRTEGPPPFERIELVAQDQPGAASPDPAPPRPAGASRPALPPFSLPVFVAAVAAGLAGHFVPGPAGVAVALVFAAFGGVAAGLLAGGSPALPSVSGAKTGEALTRERDRAERATRELERARRHAEIATSQLRDGKDPLTEVPELRVGPLRELLQAAEAMASTPNVSRLAVTEADLVATDGEPLPVPWPAGVDEATAAGPEDVLAGESFNHADTVRDFDRLIAGLEELAGAFRAPAPVQGSDGARSPAQLVDAVVQTAADGIEDLAAGLMRANELAGVAERVTNKATLLALNAALEATRSGSEAFAAIAEETRRLAEFAREATDTISRLSSEIEYKVGETITAIHATSEDAKSAVAAFPAGTAAPRTAPSSAPAQVEALLRRAREIKKRLAA